MRQKFACSNSPWILRNNRMGFLAIAQKLRQTHVFIRQTDNKSVLRI